NELEDLLDARLEDLAEDLTAEDAGGAAPDAGDLDGVLAVDHGREAAAVLLLHALGLVGRGAQPDGDVRGQVVPTQRDDRGVDDRPLLEDGDVGGAAAD